MSTNGLIFILDENEQALCCIYSHRDSNLEPLGIKLERFLDITRITVGLGLDNTGLTNGMGDLAAQLVAFLKTEPGSYYLYPVESTLKGKLSKISEYIYFVLPPEKDTPNARLVIYSSSFLQKHLDKENRFY
jgi:hypothetical protein